jgi:hypothetical protein
LTCAPQPEALLTTIASTPPADPTPAATTRRCCDARRQAAVVVVQVVADRAAAARARREHRLHADRVQHARGGRVDRGQHGRLHAAVEQDRLARVRPRGPAARGAPLGHLLAQRRRHQRAQRLAHAHRGAEQALARQRLAQRAAQHPLAHGRSTLLSTILRPMSTRRPYLHAEGQVVSQLRQSGTGPGAASWRAWARRPPSPASSGRCGRAGRSSSSPSSW